MAKRKTVAEQLAENRDVLAEIRQNRQALQNIDDSIKDTVRVVQKVQEVALEMDQKYREFIAQVNVEIEKLTDQVQALCVEITKLKLTLYGEQDDPNPTSVLARCKDHDDRTKRLEAVIDGEDLAKALGRGKEIGKLEGAKEAERKADRRRDFTVKKWQIIVSATALVLGPSGLLVTLHLLGVF